MILIADSGSTKTMWALLGEQGFVSKYDSIGLNPRVGEVEATLREVRQWVGEREVEEVYFYGAGCGNEEGCKRVRGPLQELFPSAKVVVDSDLMGACVGLLGAKCGMVGIIGTGSNACLYDGQRITERMPSLGYVLGDEGSGNHIGRQLLKSYFEEVMPAELRWLFEVECNVDYGRVIHRLYSAERPNAYLASFAPFASRHRENPFIRVLLNGCFEAYFEHVVLPLGEGKVHLAGSVAYHFQEEIKYVAKALGVSVSATIVKSPIDGLIRYHSSKE